MTRPTKKVKSSAVELKLRDFAMTFPEATEDFPWGHRAIKVKGKAFIFMGGFEGKPGFGLSVKLPVTGGVALSLPVCEPTGYGLGKSGWVSADFGTGKVPVSMVKAWIEESYRAIAPKTLVKRLDAERGIGSVAARPSRKPKKARA